MNLKEALKKPIFSIVSETANELNLSAYEVGGWVRDLLLNRKNIKTDIDFVCIGNGIQLAKNVNKKLGKNTKHQVFKNFGTAMISYKGEIYEFVGSRKESYRASSRKPRPWRCTNPKCQASM